MTNSELKGILKNKEIYVVDNGTTKVSKLKFFTVKNNKLINITKDIAEAGKLKTTREGEIKDTVIGMSRTFSVLGSLETTDFVRFKKMTNEFLFVETVQGKKEIRIKRKNFFMLIFR